MKTIIQQLKREEETHEGKLKKIIECDSALIRVSKFKKFMTMVLCIVAECSKSRILGVTGKAMVEFLEGENFLVDVHCVKASEDIDCYVK